MSSRHSPAHDWRRKAVTRNRTPLPLDTRSEEEKARDGIPANQQQRGRYMGGPGKRLFP